MNSGAQMFGSPLVRPMVVPGQGMNPLFVQMMMQKLGLQNAMMQQGGGGGGGAQPGWFSSMWGDRAPRTGGARALQGTPNPLEMRNPMKGKPKRPERPTAGR